MRVYIYTNASYSRICLQVWCGLVAVFFGGEGGEGAGYLGSNALLLEYVRRSVLLLCKARHSQK